MRIIIGNRVTEIQKGGSDAFLKYNPVDKIKKYLSYRVQGYQFTPAYRNKAPGKRWDGWVSMLSYKKFATGLLPAVLEYIEQDLPDLEITIEDQRDNMPVILPDVPLDFGEITLREDQIEAVLTLDNTIEFRGQSIPFPRGLVDAATNAGKTLVMASMWRRISTPGKCLLLVDRVQTFNEMVRMFSQWFGVGTIKGDTFDLRDFTIGMVTAVKKHMKSVNTLQQLQQVSVIFIDECHTAGSKTCTSVMGALDAPIRLLFSGTPLETKDLGKKLAILGHGGPHIYRITNRELMDKDISLEAKVHFMLCDTGDNHYDYRHEVEKAIIFSERRVEIIAEIINEYEPGKQILIAFKFHRHGEFMLKRLRELCPTVIMEMAHGLDEDAEGKLKRFKDTDTQVLIGSTIFSQSINVPCIEVIIYTIGGKDVTTYKQFLGRGTRLYKGISELQFYDFFDNSIYLSKHSRYRIKVMKKEELEVDFNYEHNAQYSPK